MTDIFPFEIKFMKQSLWLVATAAALTACGGGGGGYAGNIALPIAQSQTPAPVSPPASEPERAPEPEQAPTPSARTARYQALPAPFAREDLAAQLNVQGANGWRYVSPMMFGATQYSLFVHDAETTYSYEILSASVSLVSASQQMNDQGARGFRFAGDLSGSWSLMGAIYRKDNQSSATFDYRFERVQVGETTGDRVNIANMRGAEGYLLLGLVYYGDESGRFFERTSGTDARYAYELVAPAADAADFAAHLNVQGARGFRYKSGMGDPQGNLYEKDTAQAATFAYQVLPSQETETDLVAQANAQGALGSMWIGNLTVGDTTRSYYFTPNACSGLLCDTRGAFGF